MNKALIADIQRASIHDGPGLRTTVFFKGCPLKCRWCHNPESISFEPEIMHYPEKCIGCGMCEKGCFSGAKVICGKEYTACELLAEIIRDKEYYGCDGGVTFSGGEPLFQGAFLLECLSYMKGKLHTAVQTSGFASRDTFARVMGLADYFLYDLKIIDPTRHKDYTGVDNSPILENFHALAGGNVPFTVRIPLIPGVTDTAENLTSIARLLQEHRVGYAELLPYNKMAGGKYRLMGRTYEPRFDEQTEVTPHREIFDAYSIQTEIL